MEILKNWLLLPESERAILRKQDTQRELIERDHRQADKNFQKYGRTPLTWYNLSGWFWVAFIGVYFGILLPIAMLSLILTGRFVINWSAYKIYNKVHKIDDSEKSLSEKMEDIAGVIGYIFDNQRKRLRGSQ